MLGRMTEDHFMSSIIKSDTWLSCVDRPIAATLVALTLAVLARRGLVALRSQSLRPVHPPKLA